MKLVIIFILLILIELTFSYKVLVFNPAFGASHSNFLGKISDILLDAGHDVTMLIPVFMSSKKDLVGSKKITKIIRIDQDRRSKQMHEEANLEEMMKKQIWKLDADNSAFFFMIKNFSLACGYECEPLFDHIGVKTVINADSVLHLDIVKYALGEPASTSFYPGPFSKFIDKMSFFERTRNLLGYAFLWYFSWTRFQAELEAIKPYYNKSLSWEDHINGAAFYLINSNQYLDFASPTLPKTVFIGGMQVNTKKDGKMELEKEWDDLLSLRKENVLVSFGSNAFSSDMPAEFKKAFLEVFASMPDTTFIWKYEEANATLADHLPNVKLTTWMPQNDLLADDRLTLFITHGGLGSSIELAYQGKPSLVIPLTSDQPRNALMLTRHGGALELDKTNLDKPNKILHAIKTILDDPNYRKNAEKLASILSSQPHQPKDVVLKHCDFAVKFGDLKTLNSEGRNLNLLQFYSIDIALAALAVTVSVLLIVASLIRCLFRKIVSLFLNVKIKTE
ncbi:hypothetical protein CAEBREN_02252 [Caenorhabditis brenneri]|uniref:glucuronosyltransferase n=1 Tax=Caenorhabditis brenneri TaxID=135651 RepID=G0NN69_CAEBE|nr:hypothetical protein CAEBREN_02252 [Caenorhabditis brenneri]